MKKILALLSFLFVFNIVNAQHNPGSLIKKLKVLEEIVTQGARQAADIKFDSSGNCISHKYVDFTRELTPAWLLNVYSGPRLTRSFFTFSPSPNDTTVLDYIYDSKGNLSALVNKNGHFDTKYAYDSSGEKIKEIGFGKSDRAVVEYDYKYDKNGNKTIESIKLLSSNQERRYFYDSLNREIRMKYTINGTLHSESEKIYDRHTNLLVKTINDEGGKVDKIDGVIYFYDNKGRLIKRSHFKQEKGKEVIIGEEDFEYYDNDLIKTYTENINTINHATRTFDYIYQFIL